MSRTMGRAFRLSCGRGYFELFFQGHRGPDTAEGGLGIGLALVLRRLEGFAPEVALLDIGLPVMDGYELVEQLRGS